ncbi:MAG: sporulation transcriptional regulator SpoIIID [Clostridia bacterium]|nr:sporulation transcriptional regulator SpoIIID [Clostridia bacterium]
MLGIDLSPAAVAAALGDYPAVAEILAQNKAERHLRGGEATRQKYLNLREHRIEK